LKVNFEGLKVSSLNALYVEQELGGIFLSLEDTLPSDDVANVNKHPHTADEGDMKLVRACYIDPGSMLKREPLFKGNAPGQAVKVMGYSIQTICL